MKTLIIKHGLTYAFLLSIFAFSSSSFTTVNADLFTIEDIHSKLTERYFTMTLTSTIEEEMSFRIMTLMGDVKLENTKAIKKGKNAISFDLEMMELGSYQIAIKIRNQINVLQVKKVSSEEIKTINLANKDKRKDN